MNIKRLNYIDVAKGIGMLLVVIGHCSNTIANQYIYSFHMPLFFIITGILYRIHYDQTILRYNNFRMEGFYEYS